MKNMKLYDSDLGKFRFLLHALDASFIEDQTGFKKDVISKQKKNPNPNYDTIQKIISIKPQEKSLTLGKQCLLYGKLSELVGVVKKENRNWMNHTILKLNTISEFKEFIYLLKYTNTNPDMIARLELINFGKLRDVGSNVKSPAHDTFIEKAFATFYPHDQLRNELKINFSAQLADIIDPSSIEFHYSENPDDYYEDLRYDYFFKNETIEKQEAYLAYFLTQQYKLFKSIQEEMLRPFMNSLNILETEIPTEFFEQNENWVRTREFSVSKDVVRPELITKMLNFGFRERGEILIYSF